MAYSLDGDTLLSSGLDIKLKLWDAHSGDLISAFNGRRSDFLSNIVSFFAIMMEQFFGSGESVAYSPDGDTLLSTSIGCLLYTSPSPRDKRQSRMPSSA